MKQILAENKKVGFEYELLERNEAGIVLTGAEVKSAKSGGMSIKGAHIVFHNGEPFLIGASIARYKKSGAIDYDSERTRKLLLKRAEISRLFGKSQERGLTIVPVLVYTKQGKIKVEIALGKGKKQYEKKEKIKQRDIEREVSRTLKNR